MESNKPSVTALISAFGRAYHATHAEQKIFDDYLADQFFTDEQRAFFADNLSRAFAFFDSEGAAHVTTQQEALASFMRNQSLSITLSRARYVEEILEREIKNGVTQYVILGAGLDTFAFRRSDLIARLELFEVDYPATQNYKRARIQELGWQAPPQLHWAPLDFAQGNLMGALKAAGYDAGALTLFSWLGVTYYLARAVIDATLRDIAAHTRPGSIIIFDYLDADAFIPERVAPRVASMQAATLRSGEPMQTGFDPASLDAELNALGFALSENSSPDDIQEKYFRKRVDGYYAFEHIHFARATVK
ncbi:MAG: S-adenosyl-L-methionine-dependent methyltransferase [Chloroflexota bacterium]|nr:MAG: S-adenosyl-L-methionine-dependent methyltransferase [Chloroflexota bacterium]